MTLNKLFLTQLEMKQNKILNEDTHEEIDLEFVKPNNKECGLCDIEYTCQECERNQVKEKHPTAIYRGYGVWIKLKAKQ